LTSFCPFSDLGRGGGGHAGDIRRSAANRLRWSKHGSFRASDRSSARVVQSFLWILASIRPQVPARAQFSGERERAVSGCQRGGTQLLSLNDSHALDTPPRDACSKSVQTR